MEHHTLIPCGWIYLNFLKLQACFYKIRERHLYSDSVVDPKTIWPNKLVVKELTKSWPCSKECSTDIESHLLTRQARQRQFRRAQHVGGQEKGRLTVVDVMKHLTGQRKLILGSTYEFINMTGRAGESKKNPKRKEGCLLRKDKHNMQ